MERTEKGTFKSEDPLSKPIGLRLPKRFEDLFRAEAKKRGLPVTQLAREIIIEWIENLKKEPQ